MSRKDSLIQIETANVHKLTEAMENLLVRPFCQFLIRHLSISSKEMQDFSDDYMHLLQNSDLTNDNERTRCIQAATILTQALAVQLQPGTRSIPFETKKNLCSLSMLRNGEDELDSTETRVPRTNSKSIFLTL